jgi:murein DD-endopeptidase MepM/ murein hydrolase activator NlpD
MAQVLAAAHTLFRDRDFFIHDGSRLRRFRVSAPVQAVFFVIMMSLVAWASFATARLITRPHSMSLSEATEARARLIEKRQALIEAMLSGQKVDPALIKAAAQSGSLAASGPLARVEQAQFEQAALAAQALDVRYEVTAAELKKLDQLQDGVIAIPSDKPIRSAVSFTSGFGVRSDPFRGGAAMHPGIDLAGQIGTPIYATADGTVLRAGWNSGGYGNLVEVDHGRGITTRYGHLSAIVVHEGDRVTRGQLVGRMGSTGRSTGSHLHYEVRIDGRAVNPIPFMKSTDYVLAMQRRANAAPMESLAVGGPGGGK